MISIIVSMSVATLTAGYNLNLDTQFLDKHNELRATTAKGNTPGVSGNQPSAANMAKLEWDAGLAQLAATYIEKCVWGHNPNKPTELESLQTSFTYARGKYMGDKVGENIAVVGYNNFTEAADWEGIISEDGFKNLTINRVVEWYNEAEDYEFAPFLYEDNVHDYTQVVWATTRYVGCAYTIDCASLTNTWYTYPIYVVCNYYQAGNWHAQKPYENGTHCSNCPLELPVCDNGLCAVDPNATANPTEAPSNPSENPTENPTLTQSNPTASPSVQPGNPTVGPTAEPTVGNPTVGPNDNSAGRLKVVYTFVICAVALLARFTI